MQSWRSEKSKGGLLDGESPGVPGQKAFMPPHLPTCKPVEPARHKNWVELTPSTASVSTENDCTSTADGGSEDGAAHVGPPPGLDPITGHVLPGIAAWEQNWPAAAPMESQASAWYRQVAAWYGWDPKAAGAQRRYAWTGAWGNQMAAMDVQPQIATYQPQSQLWGQPLSLIWAADDDSDSDESESEEEQEQSDHGVCVICDGTGLLLGGAPCPLCD
jgi:hypothetical protein